MRISAQSPNHLRLSRLSPARAQCLRAAECESRAIPEDWLYCDIQKAVRVAVLHPDVASNPRLQPVPFHESFAEHASPRTKGRQPQMHRPVLSQSVIRHKALHELATASGQSK